MRDNTALARATDRFISSARQPETARPTLTFPAHVEELLLKLQTRFPIARTQESWDFVQDTIDYGKQCAKLTPDQADAVYDIAIARHPYRPSVAHFAMIVNEVIAVPVVEVLPPHVEAANKDARTLRAEAEAYRGGTGPRRLESTEATVGETASRQSFRDRVRNLPGFKASGTVAESERLNQYAERMVDEATIRATGTKKTTMSPLRDSLGDAMATRLEETK